MKRILSILALALVLASCGKNDFHIGKTFNENDLLGIWALTTYVTDDYSVYQDMPVATEFTADHKGVQRAFNDIDEFCWSLSGNSLSLAWTNGNPAADFELLEMGKERMSYLSYWGSPVPYHEYYVNISRLLPGTWKVVMPGFADYIVNIDSSGNSTWQNVEGGSLMSVDWSLKTSNETPYAIIQLDGVNVSFDDTYHILSASASSLVANNKNNGYVYFYKISGRLKFNDSDLFGIWVCTKMIASDGDTSYDRPLTHTFAADHTGNSRYYVSPYNYSWGLADDRLVFSNENMPTVRINSLDGLHLCTTEEEEGSSYYLYFSKLDKLLTGNWKVIWGGDPLYNVTISADGTSKWQDLSAKETYSYNWKLSSSDDFYNPVLLFENELGSGLFVIWSASDDVLVTTIHRSSDIDVKFIRE